MTEAAAPATGGDDARLAAGLTRSAHAPKRAADDPSITKNSVNIQPSVLIFQSSGAELMMPMARLSGSQNTLNPYAMPMDR